MQSFSCLLAFLLIHVTFFLYLSQIHSSTLITFIFGFNMISQGMLNHSLKSKESAITQITFDIHLKYKNTNIQKSIFILYRNKSCDYIIFMFNRRIQIHSIKFKYHRNQKKDTVWFWCSKQLQFLLYLKNTYSYVKIRYQIKKRKKKERKKLEETFWWKWKRRFPRNHYMRDLQIL